MKKRPSLKKVVTIILSVVMLMTPIMASAEFYFDIIPSSSFTRDEFYKIVQISDSLTLYDSIFEVDGKLYNKNGSFDIMLATSLYNNTGSIEWEYVQTENGYIARKTNSDGIPLNLMEANPLYYFDSDINIVKEINLDGYTFAKVVNYYNGVYYCTYSQKFRAMLDDNGDVSEWGEPINDPLPQYNGKNIIRKDITVMSTDMENWTEIETIPNIPKTNDEIQWLDGQIAIGDQKMKHVVYESEKPDYIQNFGKWFVFQKDDEALYLSNDNVNFVKIHIPLEHEIFSNTEHIKTFFNGLPVIPNERVTIQEVSEIDGNIVINWALDNTIPNSYFITPAQPVYNELSRLKTTPFVCLNDTILGFEVPPTIEDDRTLIPLRFLFEQMGDDVDWDAAARTATIANEENEISVSIDNPVATLNGVSEEMDVPARLIDGKTMVPLRFLSEGLGYDVEWDAETRVITITTDPVAVMMKNIMKAF